MGQLSRTCGSINWLRFVVVSFFFAGACSSNAGSMVEAYEAARLVDPSVRSAQESLDAGKSRAEQARGARLPAVNLTAGSGRAHTEYQPGPERYETTRTLGINATQPIYRPNILITIAQADEQVSSLTAALNAALGDLFLRVAQGYVDVLAANDVLGLVRAQKIALESQLSQAKKTFLLGTTTVIDQREAQSRFDLVLAQEIGAVNDLQLKQLILDDLLGVSGFRPAPIASDFFSVTGENQSLDSWISTAWQSQPSVLQAETAVRIAALEVDKAETANRPAIDLVVGYNRQTYPNGTVTFATPYRTTGTSVGVQLTYPIFSGFAIQNRIGEAISLQQKAEADLLAVRKDIAQKVRTFFFAANSSFQQAKALEVAEASSLAALEANKIAYGVGFRINIDVLNSEFQLFQTRRDLAQARYSALISGLKLKQFAGIIGLQDFYLANSLFLPK